MIKSSFRTLTIALAVAAFAAHDAQAQRTVPVANGTAYTLTAGPLALQVGPTRGARLRSLKFEGTELFYQDSSGSPSSHGSSFWPSPQAHWSATCRANNNNGCWIPPTTLDGSGAAAIYTGGLLAADTAVSYVSGLDVQVPTGSNGGGTRLRLRKTVWANQHDTSIGIRYHMVNGDTVKKAYAPWEVTRFPSGGLLFWPKDASDTIKGNGTAGTAMMAMVRDTLDTKWFKYDSATVPTSGTPKLWDGGTGGWFARVDKSRLVYIKKFTDTPKSKKAPVNENEIEIYSANRSGATGGMALLEMELQGPFDSIAVGDSSTWDVKWLVRRLPDSIPISRNAQLLAYVNQIIAGPTSLQPGQRLGGVSARLNLTAGQVSIALGAAAPVSLDLVDTRGRLVERLHSGVLPEGRHSFSLPATSRGVHYVVLRDAQAHVLESRLIPAL